MNKRGYEPTGDEREVAKEIEDLETELSEVKAELEKWKHMPNNSKGDGVEVLRKKLVEVLRKKLVETLREKLDEKNTELAGVKLELEQKNKDFAQVKGELEKTKKELAEVKAELEKWKHKPNNYKVLCEIRDKEIEDLETKLSEVKAELKKWKHKPDNPKDDGVETLRKKLVEDLQEKLVEDLQEKLDEKNAELEGVKSELERKNKDFAQVKGELEKTNNELSEVKEELEKWKHMPDNSKELLDIRDKEIERLQNELKAQPGYNIIWGHIWKGLAVLLDVIVIWLFACCSSGFITMATGMLVLFMTWVNLLILATRRIRHCISVFTNVRFDTITLLANIFGSVCSLAVFILIILVFGVGL